MKVNLSHGSVVKGSSHFADVHLLAFVLFCFFVISSKGRRIFALCPKAFGTDLGTSLILSALRKNIFRKTVAKNLRVPRTGQPTDEVGLAKGPAKRRTPGTCVAFTGWDYKSQNAGSY